MKVSEYHLNAEDVTVLITKGHNCIVWCFFFVRIQLQHFCQRISFTHKALSTFSTMENGNEELGVIKSVIVSLNSGGRICKSSIYVVLGFAYKLTILAPDRQISCPSSSWKISLLESYSL